ncbi:MAG: hypothetical protein RL417_1306 [Pseudomonadota bacterium]|jgi:S-adenosylmethionine decarboxylase
MQRRVSHILVDCWGVSSEISNSAPRLEALLREAAAAAGATVLESKTHTFSPHGVTTFVLLAESHVALHSWPEDGYVSFDVLMCGGEVERALEVLLQGLAPERHTTQVVMRGGEQAPGGPRERAA